MRNAIIPLLLALMSGLWVHGQSPPPDSLGERFWIAKLELLQPVLMAARGGAYGGVELEKVMGKGRLNPVVGVGVGSTDNLSRNRSSLKQMNPNVMLGVRHYLPFFRENLPGPQGLFWEADIVTSGTFLFEPYLVEGNRMPAAYCSMGFGIGGGFQKSISKWQFSLSGRLMVAESSYARFSFLIGRRLP